MRAVAVLASLAVAFAAGQAAWCAWEWVQHGPRWSPFPAFAPWGAAAVAVLQAIALVPAYGRMRPAWIGAAAAVGAAELAFVDGSGRSWLWLAAPAALWCGFLLSGLELVRWRSWSHDGPARQPAHSLDDLWRAYDLRTPFLVLAGLAVGFAAALVPWALASWLGTPWSDAVEARAAFTAGGWTLLLEAMACAVWIATRPRPSGET